MYAPPDKNCWKQNISYLPNFGTELKTQLKSISSRPLQTRFVDNIFENRIITDPRTAEFRRPSYSVGIDDIRIINCNSKFSYPSGTISSKNSCYKCNNNIIMPP